jgi:hypothetical protein
MVIEDWFALALRVVGICLLTSGLGKMLANKFLRPGYKSSGLARNNQVTDRAVISMILIIVGACQLSFQRAFGQVSPNSKTTLVY